MAYYNTNGVALVAERVTFTGGEYVPSKTCMGFKVDSTGTVEFVSGGNTVTATCSAGDTWATRVDSIVESGTTAGVVAFVTN